MKTILKLEELGMLALGLYLFSRLSFSWWYFPLLLLLPDLGMIGYLVNNKIGAWTYNLFHHKGLAVLVYLCGLMVFNSEIIQLVGIILFSHAAMDRLFGYGLKYEQGFKFTHLGSIGKT